MAIVGTMTTELVPPTMAPTITHANGGEGRTYPSFVDSQKNAQTAIKENANPDKPRRMPRGAAAATSVNWRRKAPVDRMTVRAMAPKNGMPGLRSPDGIRHDSGLARMPA